MKLFKYRHLCDTEAAYAYTNYIPDTDPVPTVCPNDPAHTLNAGDTWTIVDTQGDVMALDPMGRQRVANEVHTYGSKLYVGGVRLEIPAGSVSKDFFVKIVNRSTSAPVAFELYSGGIAPDANARFGDTFDGHVVDHDNVLGYGVDFVLDAFIDDFPIIAMINRDLPPPDRVAAMPAGFYLRYRYKSFDANNANPVTMLGYVVGYRAVAVKLVVT
jgi:hypothetical protein